VAVLTAVAMLMARVTLISAPDTKRGPVVYDDPSDANGAVAGTPQRLAPRRGPCLWRVVVSIRSWPEVILTVYPPVDTVATREDADAAGCCRRQPGLA
jgi:hypothetical protein